MPLVAFMCTRPDRLDPICHVDQQALLLLAGAIGGAFLLRSRLRERECQPVVSALLYVSYCLSCAVFTLVAAILLT